MVLGYSFPVLFCSFVSCCHFILPAHLCSQCSVSLMCSSPAWSPPLTCFTSVTTIIHIAAGLFSASLHLHLMFAFLPVWFSHSLLIIVSLNCPSGCSFLTFVCLYISFLGYPFACLLLLTFFFFLHFGFHIGHQLFKAHFLFSTCLPPCQWVIGTFGQCETDITLINEKPVLQTGSCSVKDMGVLLHDDNRILHFLELDS